MFAKIRLMMEVSTHGTKTAFRIEFVKRISHGMMCVCINVLIIFNCNIRPILHISHHTFFIFVYILHLRLCLPTIPKLTDFTSVPHQVNYCIFCSFRS